MFSRYSPGIPQKMNTIQPEPVNAVRRTSFSVTGEIGGTR